MRGRASAALAVGCLIVVFSAAAATAATRSQVFRVEIAGYDAKYPDQLFQIRYRGPFSKGGGVHTLECPVRCAFAFGPGTGVSAPVSFTVADDSSSSRAISAYETKFGLPYQVLGYQGCKAAFLSDPLQSSCSGQTSRSTTIRISLRYRPLLRVALTGQVEAHPGPPVGGGFLDLGATSVTDPYGSPGQNAGAGCTIYVGFEQGACAGHLNPGAIDVSATGNQAPFWQFAGFDGPCAGQGGPFTPTSAAHTCRVQIHRRPDADRDHHEHVLYVHDDLVGLPAAAGDRTATTKGAGRVRTRRPALAERRQRDLR
jgi:hypothetical protein